MSFWKTRLSVFRATAMFLAGIWMFSGSPVLAAESRVLLSGSTTILPIVQKAVEVFMQKNPSARMEVAGGGSGNGIKALIDKSADIAMASRPMKAKEEESAAAAGVSPRKHVVALDAVLPVVHPSNPVKNLTIEQLRDIYAGRVTNWKEVGGVDGKIVVVTRDTSSGTYETWQEFVLGEKTRVFAGALSQASSGAVLQTVAQNPRAIGYEGIGYVNKTVKALTVNGVAGTAATVRGGTYPVARELFLYTNGDPKGLTAQFLAFLAGGEGRELISSVGFIPLK